MLAIKKIVSLNELNALKATYFTQSTAPLDGMWHFAFVPMATHFGFYINTTLLGFCCINEEGYMLQFYLQPNAETNAKKLFTLIAQQNSKVIGKVKGAFVSTAEPSYLSLCLDNSTTFTVNALMYQQALEKSVIPSEAIEPIAMQQVAEQQLAELVEFAMAAIGAPQEWLSGYYHNLIKRNELFAYWHKGELLAAGECRLFDHYQTEYAELGMIVAKSARGQGMAKRVLHYLKTHAEQQGLQAICSTESSNIAAQKAITSAGFVADNRIVQFEFTSS
ncbi:GNAT family N-acetyltransferase [Colwellia psychrerythraea]|uniref:GCN5-related N-acetyltransferase n=1 Tax=Colwellia psychrerythraea TaxID=28229 RepID=A0A099KKL4_COLPS|nr:GNAT family N-acetyltransferase [Colwellia psychrerythraea]KGJ90971.1 GCN5-related N-acetyltransferase [Colwellia psychrerythraea]